jgi:hypothetical protein
MFYLIYNGLDSLCSDFNFYPVNMKMDTGKVLSDDFFNREDDDLLAFVNKKSVLIRGICR